MKYHSTLILVSFSSVVEEKVKQGKQIAHMQSIHTKVVHHIVVLLKQ